MNKIISKFKCENKKKQAGLVFLLILAVTVICEIFIFNFKFWGSLRSERVSVAPSVINGATDLGDNRYRLYKRHAYLEYDGIGAKID